MTNNSMVLSIVFLAVVIGLCINALGEKILVLKNLLIDINNIISVFLGFIITKFSPIAVFVLVTRTFAVYGLDRLKPALAYMLTVALASVIFLIIAYPLFVYLLTKLNPFIFMKKIAKVALLGFSAAASSAALSLNEKTTVEELGVDKDIASFVLPLGMTINMNGTAIMQFSAAASSAALSLNEKTTVEELGVDKDIASFVLPLGMTINMNGTAIMQVIAAIFIAASSGYSLTIQNVILIAVLALIASIGTPSAPGSSSIILFTVLTGMGFNNEATLIAYSLIIAINRPIDMLITCLNVIGDSATAVVVANSEGSLDKNIYNN